MSAVCSKPTLDAHSTTTQLSPSPAETLTRKKPQLRSHPPRLQHSPSLPNLWLPPHFGPLPLRLTNVPRDNLHQPATPPSLMANAPLPDIKLRQNVGIIVDTEKKTLDDSQVRNSSDSGHRTGRTQPIAKTIHRRPKADQDQLLLTPPLTPSSSIRTTTSVDSGAHTVSTVTSIDLHEISNCLSSDVEVARFLIVQNVAQHASADELRSAFCTALYSEKVGPSLSSRLASAQEGPIKGMLLRHQESQGIVLLAFFDIRVAARAKQIFEQSDAITNSCISDGEKHVTCRFANLEEVIQLAGYSDFLSSMDSSFFLQVEMRRSTLEAPKAGKEGDGADIEQMEVSSNDVDMAMLKSIVNSYGAVKTFSASKSHMSLAQVFLVDYYDLRDANSAFVELNNQSIFGMKFQAYKTVDDLKQEKVRGSLYLGPGESADSSKGSIPFPSSENNIEVNHNVGLPGRHSNIHERLLTKDLGGRVRTRCVSADDSPISAASPTTPSSNQSLCAPIYLYSSPVSPSTTNYRIPQLHDAHGRRGSNHLFFDAVKKLQPAQRVQISTASQDSQPSPLDTKEADECQGEQACQQETSQSQDEESRCEYLHPHGVTQSPPLGHSFYTASPAPSLPAIYPSQRLTPALVPTFPPTIGFPYDYEHAQAMNTNMNAVINLNMAFDYPMMVAANQTMTPTHNVLLNSPYYAPHQPQPPPPPRIQSSYFPDPCKLPMSYDPSFDGVYVTGHGALPSPSPPLRPVSVAAPSKIPEKHNQLNLAAIEAGQDTRTTVMIRNIPNKMSDKDLIAYIDSVCPRRIDFLYLRMDFQNGCNVGYAFVNFITVEDLLKFARAKLGEKWNMFASEKVLEMSYADYQGKEAQVEKFKNSSIMDEQEAWRPKIFYSDGPNQGLPEPFPAPTHLRRKQLSSHNRVGLFLSSGSQDAPHGRRASRLSDQRSHRGRDAGDRGFEGAKKSSLHRSSK